VGRWSGEDDGVRADGRRNRERVLAAAIEVFAAEGLGVPVAEIARRAGVGTGTVSRHFPTKQALYDAIVQHRVERLVAEAESLAERLEPGPALFAYIEHMVGQASADQGLADALSRTGYDVDEAAKRTGYDVKGALAGLLRSAQEAGVVRPDVDAVDVKALIAGCVARSTADPDVRRRVVDVVVRGLQP